MIEDGEVKKALSIIAEDSLESNISEKDEIENKRVEKMTDSDWDSKEKGGSEKGFDMAKIKWTDLGRKFIVKRGQKTNMPELEYSM